MTGISGFIRPSSFPQELDLGVSCRRQEPGGPRLFRRGGVCLVFEGEIYSQRTNGGTSGEGHVLDAGSVIANLYERHGAEFVQELRGSFAVALWDAKAQRFLLAVDPFATRPLYYASEGGLLAFGSRASDLLAYPEIPREIDANALYLFLTYSYIPAPFTIYRHIRRLQPGQVLVWEKDTLGIKQYWDLTYEEDRGLSEKEAATLVRETLEDSVRVRLREGEVPLVAGAFLSGGTDSSTLVGLMTKIRGRGLKTFSVGFSEERYNEIEYARIASRHFYTESYERFVNPGEALRILPRLALIYDEPFGNSSVIPTFYCLKTAADAGVKVMFAGDGGDELFAGNERYVTEKILSLYQRLPGSVRRCMDPAAESLPEVYPFVRLRNYIRRSNRHNPERFFSYDLYLREHGDEFFTAEFKESVSDDCLLQVAGDYYRKLNGASWINRLLYLDMKLAIADNDLFKVNRAAESLGIQVRYPYLDTRLAAAAGKIPAHLKLKGFSKRYIFKKAFQDLLPEEILKKKKQGFGLPTGDWLRSHPGFRELARSLLLDSRSLQRGYFNRKALESLLDSHDKETSSYYGTFIWNFMMLELWHRSHSDRPTADT